MPTIPATQIKTGFTGLQSQDIESFLSKTFVDTEHDKANALIAAAEAELCTRCYRNFDPTQIYDEYFDANIVELMPRNTPLDSIHTIVVNGTDVTSQYVLNTDYWVYDNFFVFAKPIVCFGYPQKAIKLSYKLRQWWGEDLVNMVKQKAAYEFLKSDNGGVALTQFGFSGMNQSFDVVGFVKKWEDFIFSNTLFSL